VAARAEGGVENPQLRRSIDVSDCSIRAEVRQRGLRFGDVLDAYRELKHAEQSKRERPNEVRRAAWFLATASSPGCWPFWRHGFTARWGHRIARGDDYTVVPGYDEIASAVATEFPEYADDAGPERLWDFLFSPFEPLPSRECLLRRAMEVVEAEQGEPVPF
jgi:hypothetical protein